MQVGTNGVLSFRAPFTEFTPVPFPLQFVNNTLIAPFWDDSDSSSGGQVLYRFTSDEAILDEISANVSDVFAVNFTPVSAFIATWFEIPQAFTFSGEVSSLNGVSTKVLCCYTCQDRVLL